MIGRGPPEKPVDHGEGWDERPIGSGPAVKLLKRRLDGRRLLLLVCSLSRLSTPSIAKILNRDKHESLVFVPFQSPLLRLVPLLVPNSEYTMKIEVLCSYSPVPKVLAPWLV